MNTILSNETKILEGLKKVGYYATTETAIAIRNAYLLKKPLFIEGPPGVGKTQLAKALKEMLTCHWFRLQCTPEITERKAIYEMNYQKQLLHIQLYKEQEQQGISENSFFTRDYLIERPILQAMQQEEAAVLLVDELDKASEDFEYSLLEVFGEYSVSIPELKETIFAKNIPFTIITSNNARPISGTILRRCVYLYIDYPTIEEEISILQTIGKVNESIASGVAKVMHEIRNGELKLKQKPSISESMEWAKIIAIHVENSSGEQKLQSEMLKNVSVIAKTKEDKKKISEKIEAIIA